MAFTKAGANGPEQDFHDVDARLADSHLFASLGVPLLHGRLITDSDRSDSEPICLINLAMARKYWPDRDPLGQLIILQRLDVNGQKRPRRVVGIVTDTRDRINEEPQPMVYLPYSQESFFTMQLLVHSRQSMAEVRKSVAAVLSSVDPDEPIRSIHDFENFLPGALQDWTLAISLLGGLATVAILLTAIGVFAVIGYMVRERTREIGIRMAVGATPQRVRNMVLGQTAWVALIGAMFGIAISAACMRFLGSLIYGVRATDPLTFILAPGILGAIVLLASYVPARRAMRIDPMLALRDE
jgi:putative ABC transport system permease protein